MPREVWSFEATGQADVVAAFRSIAAESRRAAAATKASYSSTAQSASSAHVGGYRTAAKVDQQRVQSAVHANERISREEQTLQRKLRRFREQEEEREGRAQDARLRRMNRANEKIAADRRRMLGRVVEQGANMAWRGITRAGGAVEGVIGEAVRDSMKVAEIANRVSINARAAGQTAIDPKELQHEFERIAIATPGLKAADIGEAAQAYVDYTGDIKTARENLQSFATVASATGARVQDVSLAAATLGKAFDLKKLEDVQKGMAVLAFQGKGASLTLEQMATFFQRLAPAAAAFGKGIGGGSEGVATLGGLMQVVRGGVGKQQVTTATENILTRFQKQSKQLKKFGVHVYDKEGNTRPLYELLGETIAKVGGADVEKKKAGLFTIFGERGMRGINPLVKAYQEAAAGGKTPEEKQRHGYEAVVNALETAKRATADWTEIQKDAAQAQQDASAKIQAAWSQIEAQVGEELTPKLVELIGRLPELVHALDAPIGALGLLADAAIGVTNWWLRLTGRGEEVERFQRMQQTRKQAGAELKQMESFYGPLSPEQTQRKKDLEQAQRTGIQMVPIGTIQGPNGPANEQGKPVDINTEPANTALDMFGNKIDLFGTKVEQAAARLEKLKLDDRPSIGRNL